MRVYGMKKFRWDSGQNTALVTFFEVKWAREVERIAGTKAEVFF